MSYNPYKKAYVTYRSRTEKILLNSLKISQKTREEEHAALLQRQGTKDLDEMSSKIGYNIIKGGSRNSARSLLSGVGDVDVQQLLAQTDSCKNFSTFCESVDVSIL